MVVRHACWISPLLALDFLLAVSASRIVPRHDAHLITPAPSATPLPASHELRRRDQAPGLCGFIDSTFPWACPASSTCYYNTDISAVGCCQSSKCQYATSCIQYDDLSSATLAASKPNVLSCTNSRSAHCGTATLDNAFYTYTCLASPTSDWTWFVYLTSTNPSGFSQTSIISRRLTGGNGGAAATVVDNSAATPTSTGKSTGTATQNGGGFAPQASTGSTGAAAGAATTSTGTAGSQAQASSSSSGAKSNIGAIVGGAVGGVAILGIVAVIIACLFLRRRKAEKSHGLAAGEGDGRYERAELDGKMAPGVEAAKANVSTPAEEHKAPVMVQVAPVEAPAHKLNRWEMPA